MSCSRPGGGGSPVATTSPKKVSQSGLASRVWTGGSALQVGISLPRPPPSRLGREPVGFPKSGCGTWRSRRGRDRSACMFGGRGGWLERSDGPFVPPAWTKTPTSAETITFAGAGRWSRAACATGTAGFCRKRAHIVRARWDSGSETAASPAWFVFSARASFEASKRPAASLRLEFWGSSACCPASSRRRWTAFLRRRARCCAPRRLLWAAPRARGASATPFISRVASLAPCPPRAGAAQDRSEPLATASLGWRMVTLLGVAQLLDLGGAGQGFGPAPFTLEQLAEWTGEAVSRRRGHSLRFVASGPVRLGKPLRPAKARRLAETILASEDGETRALARPRRGGERWDGSWSARLASAWSARLRRIHDAGPHAAGRRLAVQGSRISRPAIGGPGIHRSAAKRAQKSTPGGPFQPSRPSDRGILHYKEHHVR